MKTARCHNANIVVTGGIADEKVTALMSKKFANELLGLVFYIVKVNLASNDSMCSLYLNYTLVFIITMQLLGRALSELLTICDETQRLKILIEFY